MHCGFCVIRIFVIGDEVELRIWMENLERSVSESGELLNIAKVRIADTSFGACAFEFSESYVNEFRKKLLR